MEKHLRLSRVTVVRFATKHTIVTYVGSKNHPSRVTRWNMLTKALPNLSLLGLLAEILGKPAPRITHSVSLCRPAVIWIFKRGIFL